MWRSMPDLALAVLTSSSIRGAGQLEVGWRNVGSLLFVPRLPPESLQEALDGLLLPDLVQGSYVYCPLLEKC